MPLSHAQKRKVLSARVWHMEHILIWPWYLVTLRLNHGLRSSVSASQILVVHASQWTCFMESPWNSNHIIPCALCCCVYQAFTNLSPQACLIVFTQTAIEHWLRGLNSTTLVTSGRLETPNQGDSKIGSFWVLQGTDPWLPSWLGDGCSYPLSSTPSFLCLCLCPKFPFG